VQVNKALKASEVNLALLDLKVCCMIFYKAIGLNKIVMFIDFF